MINLEKPKQYQTWVEWPEDKNEKYLIQFLPEILNDPTDPKYANTILFRIKDWKGVYFGKEQAKCTDENKRILFEKGGVDAYQRMAFLIIKMTDPSVFFDKDEFLKNLNGA